jgi:hypothetical protein
MPASKPGPKPPATAASNSTAPRGSYEPSQPGTPVAPSPTSSPSPRLRRRASRHRRPSRSKGRRRLWGSRPGERPMSGPAPPSGWSHSPSATSRSGDQACLLHRPLCCETVRRPIRRNRRWQVTACIFVITLWHGMIRAPRSADNLCGSRRARMLSATSCIPRYCSAKRSITSARALGRERNGE